MAPTIRSYRCRVCRRQFTSLQEVKLHFEASHNVRYQCNECGISFRQLRNFRRHISELHTSVSSRHGCHWCPRKFASRQLRIDHENLFHIADNTGFRLTASSLSSTLVNYRLDFPPNRHVPNVEACLRLTGGNIKKLLKRELLSKKIIRFSIVVHAKFGKLNDMGQMTVEEVFTFRPLTQTLFLSDFASVNRYMDTCKKQLCRQSDDMENEESGWILLKVTSVIVEIGKVGLAGACSDAQSTARALHHIGNKRFLLDVPIQSPAHENMCFVYALCQGLLKATKDRNLASERTFHFIEKYVDYAKSTFPMNIKKIRFFEARNKALQFKINVFMRDNGETFPVYRSKLSHALKTINLLLIKVRDANLDTLYHYVYIKNLNRFFSKTNQPAFVCPNCLISLSKDSALQVHLEICSKQKTVKVILPDVGDKLAFLKRQRCFFQHVVGFLDFEAKLVPYTRQELADMYGCANCLTGGDLKVCLHQTRKRNRHEPISYSLLFIDLFDNVVFQRTEAHETDIMTLCFEALYEAKELILPLLNAFPFPRLTREQARTHAAATHCYLCSTPFSLNVVKVADHNHALRFGYRGAACQACNLLGRYQQDLPVFIHNFQNYDGHFIVQGLKLRKEKNSYISALPQNTQKLKTLTVSKIKFLDSLQFLQASLDVLVKSLTASDQSEANFRLLYTSGLCSTEAERKLLLRKGVFPYNYVTSLALCESTREFPPAKAFYNDLTYSHISKEDYAFATSVYETFQCQDFSDYLKLYNKLDTCLLAAVFQAFRREIFDSFQLDPCHYISLPMLAFDAALKLTGATLDLLTDSEMIMMTINGIRGGLSQVSLRQCLINNYNPQGLEHIIYIDANNLYGASLRQPLPYSDFRWLSEEAIAGIDWKNTSETSRVGYILEVDLEYPAHLHNLHSDFPLAPETREVTFEELSPYSKGNVGSREALCNEVNPNGFFLTLFFLECLRLFHGSSFAERYKDKKLCATLQDKIKYTCHYLSLKFFLQQGLILKKVHRAYSFTQESFLRDYIDLISRQRAETSCAFKKRVKKLMANSVFGKFLQNVSDVKKCSYMKKVCIVFLFYLLFIRMKNT